MALNHRKMIHNLMNTNWTDICSPYCDPAQKGRDFCPVPCFDICYGTCSSLVRQFQSPPPPAPPNSPNDTTIYYHSVDKSAKVFLIVFLVILSCTFFIVCCYCIYKMRTVWCRRREQRQEGGGINEGLRDDSQGFELDHPIWFIRTVGLQPSMIRSITVCKYNKDDVIVERAECSICLNEFQEDELLRILPKCNHAFHVQCIDTWLRSHTRCPVCRGEIVRNITTGGMEQSIHGSGDVAEETQVGVLENDLESSWDREDESSELRIEIYEEGENGGTENLEVSKDKHILEVDKVQQPDSDYESAFSSSRSNAHQEESNFNSMDSSSVGKSFQRARKCLEDQFHQGEKF